MTAREALDKIISALESPEDFTEELDFLKGIEEFPEENWKSKYEKMRDEYFKRWSEDTAPKPEQKTESIEDEREEIDISDLEMSFDGSTE